MASWRLRSDVGARICKAGRRDGRESVLSGCHLHVRQAHSELIIVANEQHSAAFLESNVLG
jgi:hypothetical protein